MNMPANPQWIWIALAAVAVLVVIGLIASSMRRHRTAQLREHFGSEYDHAVRTARNRTAAEEALLARANEVKQFDIQPLSASDRDRYRSDWQKIEARFVDRPTTAVVEADELVADVMRARGYPIADFEKHAEYLSVKHPRVVEHYRAGHAVIDAHSRGASSTEELRQAMLHYRVLFEDLVGFGGTDVEQPISASSELPARSEERVAYGRREEDHLRR
jgi:heme exporter protein D